MNQSRVSPAFKFVVFILLIIAAITAGGAVYLSIHYAAPTKSQAAATRWLFGTASSSLTALFGVFAGKVL